ncbi:MAG: hypothetical protein LIR50_12530 [Bacillota bacterium]|nr:hypothetical protein [Bacillota bacterium]
MEISVLKKYFLILRANVKHNFLPHFALSVLLLIIAPVIFGTANLNAKTAAIPLEMFIALVGIILLTPVFLPDQQKEIREVVEAKYTNQNIIYLVRIVIAVLTMLLLISGFVFYMKQSGCKFNDVSYITGTFDGSLFLGALGLFSYGVSGSISIGYMVPMVYYILNLFGGSEHLGNLYLFSMTQGSFEEKYWLLGAGISLIILTLLMKSIGKKTR